MKLSLVVPCYNEAGNVAAFQAAVIEAFRDCGYDYEIVFVNDGSRDATLHNLKKLHQAQECPVKVISFSRNFGKESGIYAGMEHASGEYICLIDADLQQQPGIVRDMVRLLDENHRAYSAYLGKDYVFASGNRTHAVHDFLADFQPCDNHAACLCVFHISSAGHSPSFYSTPPHARAQDRK